MASNTFSLGRQTSVVIIHPFAGGRLDIGIVTAFDVKQVVATVGVEPLSGGTLTQFPPKGWTGTIEFDRRGPTEEQFIFALEMAFRNNLVPPFGQAFQYTTEPSGAQTSWMYEQASFRLQTAGKFSPDSAVKMALGFSAQWRTKI